MLFRSAQLFGDTFAVYRTDRNGSNSAKTRGGGVLIAVSTRWNSYIDPSPVSDGLEQLWVRVTMPSRVVSVGVIYLPPDRRNDSSSIQDHVDSIGAIVANLGFNDFALLLGDYNQPALQWRNSDDGSMQVEPQTALMSASSALIDGFSLHSLTQLNGISNRNARFLDLVLSNEAATPACVVSEAVEPLTTLDPDHPALDVMMQLPPQVVFEARTDDSRTFDFRRADYAELSAAISRVDWRPIELADCVDDAVNYFRQTICDIMAEFVPLSRPAPKPAWSNGHLRRLKRYRAKALRRYCRNRSYITKQEFNRSSNNYRKYNRYLYRRYVLRTQASVRRNPKRFWSFVNSKKNEVGLPLSVHLGEQSASSETEKCRLYAQHFMSSFNDMSASPNQVGIATRDTPRDAFDFRSFQIDEHTVELAIQRLKLSYAVGPDGIPSSVLKLCSESLLTPLAKLFNLSLQECKFPEAWKFSYMFPVHKKGDKRNVQNYRGITSLCCCSKVFEIIINEALFSSCKNYISTAQHGFYPKRSVTTNLTEFVSLCVRTMDSGGQVDAVYTDLKAAFDRVDHCILLGKLEKLGVSDSMISWFTSYLTDRSLCVKIGASQSEVFTNISGVPQGSNLGPLLFSLFINELSRLLPPGCRLFYADDVKMYMIINSIADCEDLQQIVDHMQSWCSRNYLTLSINKCNVISFYRKKKPIRFDYSISGQILERVSQVRDLGVTLDCALTFKPHYNDVLNKANRQLGFIFKISEDFRDPLCLRALYCSLVRSILEFSAVVWCPYQACWIARFESVQRKFVRYALRHLPWRDASNLPSYGDRCRLLGIDTLETRRRNAQAVFAAKIIIGEIDSPQLLRQLYFYAPERVMRQRNFVHLATRNRQYGMNEPIRAVANAFNDAYACFDFNVPLTVFIRRMS